jgi:glycerophosphoryl diester phosphodiesterase
MIDLGRFYGGRTLNFAHRGASAYAPQNTLAAFLMAAEMGADGIELDVHLSADNEVVVIHDNTVDGTTDGRGRVSGMTLSELKRLDAGAWFDERFAGERIPTLQEVFDAVGHRLLINIEIKAERDHHPLAQEAEVVRLIEDNQIAQRVLVSSFAPSSLRRVRKMNPNIPLGFLYSRPEPLFLPRLLRWFSVPYDALHPSLGMVSRGYVERARRRGERVNVWTVNVPHDMRRMRDLGVDGIITNHPDLLRDVLVES